jgi:hypothetical protein
VGRTGWNVMECLGQCLESMVWSVAQSGKGDKGRASPGRQKRKKKGGKKKASLTYSTRSLVGRFDVLWC